MNEWTSSWIKGKKGCLVLQLVSTCDGTYLKYIKVTMDLQLPSGVSRVQAMWRVQFKLYKPKPPYQIKAYRASYPTIQIIFK